ncbi:hypothetical protein ACFVFS_40315 [Kitasatospora sp. NPDC057692]|uniref:hypothetical protein n=1 Tax=Kitasatospora sp. NPDC057692 TaxID=3346215 RepID=UPI00368F8B0B
MEASARTYVREVRAVADTARRLAGGVRGYEDIKLARLAEYRERARTALGALEPAPAAP